MDVGDTFLLVVRWLHLVSAAVWIGGSLFYLLVLRPVLRRTDDAPRALSTGTAVEFRTLVNVCIVTLVASGVILALNRLTAGVTDAPYAITLGVKSALSVWMFLIVEAERRRTRVLKLYQDTPQAERTTLQRLGSSVSGYNAVIILGIVVFFLSDLMKVLFEVALSRN